MSDPRPMHSAIRDSYPPDGRAMIACACPIANDHPLDLIAGDTGDGITVIIIGGTE